MDYINQLKIIIKKSNVTCTDIADNLGISLSALSRYLSKERKMPMETYIAICDIIGWKVRLVRKDAK